MIQYSISTPVAYLHASPDSDSEVISQAIYSWKVFLLQEENNFKYIEMADGYRGWVEARSLSPFQVPRQPLVKVMNRAAHLYDQPDLTKKKPVLTLPFESELEIVSEPEMSNFRWIEVHLIDKSTAWIQRGDISKTPYLPMDDLISFSYRFLGLPYTWGGVSSFGYDCSGFIQMLFRQIHVTLPRDSKDQVDCPLLAPIKSSEIEAGDLIYYGPYEGKVTHVALYLGSDKIIHACARPQPLLQLASFHDKEMQQTHPFRIVRRCNGCKQKCW